MSNPSEPAEPSSGGEFKPVPAGFVPSKRGEGRPLTTADLITLNEEIAGMARAGLPLDKGLTILAREMGLGRLQKVTQQLGEDLQAGFTLPQALERQKARVPPYYAALLAAAVRSGKTGEVLGTLTLYARSIAEFRATLVSALLYPLMILIVYIPLQLFVSYMILPQFVEIFESFKMRLPLATRLLIFLGNHTAELIILPIVIIVVTLLWERYWLRATVAGRLLWARFVNALPVIGTLIRSARLAAFADLLGILVDQSIPLPEAMRLAAEASSDPLLTEGGKEIEKNLRQGMPLGEALRRQRMVPELVVWMVHFGERQGTLGSALHQLAQMYRRQAEVRAALVRTILPPLLILLLAGTLGLFSIFGLMGPLLSLLDGLSGGGR